MSVVKEYRDRLMNLDKLIEEEDNLKKLTKEEAWETLMNKLAEIRVDAMDIAIAEGDTTDAKAYARAIGTIINFFHSLSGSVMLDDLQAQRDQLKKEIDMVSKERLRGSYTNQGLGATI